MKLRLLFLLLVLPAMFIRGQDYSDSWTGYFSYRNITSIATSGTRVYAAAQNSVFSYRIEDDTIETFSTIQGLSGGDISAIHFFDAGGILFVGYTSGLIDLVFPDGKVKTVVAIRDKAVILPREKIINDFEEYDNTLYISTGFGISLFDLEGLEFEDSYFIGSQGSHIPIAQLAFSGGYIYAASPTAGLFRAVASNTNLIDYNNWENLDPRGWLGIQALEEKVFGITSDRKLQELADTGFTPVETFNAPPVDFQSTGAVLAITFSQSIRIYDSSGSVNQIIPLQAGYEGTYTAGIFYEGEMYAGTSQSGMLIIGEPEDSALQVLPDGPLRNDPFSIEAAPGQLWTVYGDYDAEFNPYPLKRYGVSHFSSENGWQNIPYSELFGATNLTGITYNPENNSEVYLSSFHQGLLEVIDGVPVKIYDETNSGLTDLSINPTDVRINGAAFDQEGTLWMSNSRVENALAQKIGDQIQGISIAPLISDFQAVDAYTDLVIGRSQNVYFGSSNRGLIGYQPATNTFARLDEERSNLPSNNVQTLAVDANNNLWIGTTRGLRVLFSPAQMFNNPEIQARPIVIEENGVGVAVLSDQVILSIEVDGNDNKWIGTLDSGVFYFSPNGQETLLQFDTSNSPLPSNEIKDITIDSESGEVFFATPLGLVSYSGYAIAPQETLEEARVYPNPVRPQFNGMVTLDGLTAGAHVKITDLTGNLVHEVRSEGGSIQWDTTNFNGLRVASGVYFILIAAEEAVETKVVKLMIIR